MIRRLAVVFMLGAVCPAFADDVTLPDFDRVELGNGTILLLSEKHDVPLVGFQAVARAGAVADPDGREGLTSLLADMLEKGAGGRSAAEFAEAVEAVGAKLSSRGGRESITISAEFLARDANLLVSLIADMLQRPTLDEAEFEKLRTRRINLIKAAKDADPRALLGTYADAFLFEGHPYGKPSGGDETSLRAITLDELRSSYEQRLGADRLIIAVIGDFDREAMKALLTRHFGSWRSASASMPEIDDAEPIRGRRVLLVDKPGATQTYFDIGNVGVSIDYPARPALDLANTVFGGRFTSMLNTELRIKSGLSYGARAVLTRPSRPGSIWISSYTATETTVEAIDLALDVLDGLHDKGIHVSMIESARNYLMGQFPPELETASQLAAQLAALEFYGLDRSYVDEYIDTLGTVTAAEVRQVIADVYPSLDDLVFVLIGDAGKIRDAVEKYGDLTEMSIEAPYFVPRESAIND